MKLILITALAASLAAPGNDTGHHARSAQSAAQSHAEPKHDTGPSLPVIVQNDVERIARALEAANAKQESTRERQRAEQDLRDQDNMAKWAFYMFWVGAGELLLTAVGVFLVWRTLIHTRNAAVAARDSVNETRRIGEAQTRAYVSCAGASFVLLDGNLTVYPNFINTGQSPALHFDMECTLNFWEPGSMTDFNGPHWGSVPPIPSGQTLNGMAMIPLNEHLTQKMFVEGKDFSIKCFVRWKDVFGMEGAISASLHPLETSDMLGTGDRRYREGKMQAVNRTPISEEEMDEYEEEEEET